jgi:hypothetical protein
MLKPTTSLFIALIKVVKPKRRLFIVVIGRWEITACTGVVVSRGDTKGSVGPAFEEGNDHRHIADDDSDEGFAVRPFS